MKYKEVLKAFKDKDIIVKHGFVKNRADEVVTLPNSCYLLGSSEDVKADDRKHYKQSEMRIELYYKDLDDVLISSYEDILDSLEIGYDEDLDIYIDSEKCFMAVFTFEVER